MFLCDNQWIPTPKSYLTSIQIQPSQNQNVDNETKSCLMVHITINYAHNKAVGRGSEVGKRSIMHAVH